VRSLGCLGTTLAAWLRVFCWRVLKHSPGFNTRVVHVGYVVDKEVKYFSDHFSFLLSGIVPLLFLIHSSVIQEKVNKPGKVNDPSEAAVPRK